VLVDALPPPALDGDLLPLAISPHDLRTELIAHQSFGALGSFIDLGAGDLELLEEPVRVRRELRESGVVEGVLARDLRGVFAKTATLATPSCASSMAPRSGRMASTLAGSATRPISLSTVS
jgi:hypothetical protein